ncbi:MAG: DNA-processing protein DprA [Brevinematales bacterium]
MDDPVYYAALSSNEAVGPRRFDKIMAGYKSLRNFFNLKTDEMMEFLELKNIKLKHKFDNMLERGRNIQKICTYKNITLITREDPLYHPRLKEIPDPPFLYYQKGFIDQKMKLAAVVGTREAGSESAQINEYFTKEFVSHGIGIVSGMARGHDFIAHKTALNNNGFTAAVLGCGIDGIYPAEHRVLFDKICSRGAIISEYPPGMPALKTHFPIRNRIISGLAEAVLLVQAPQKSGALITAGYAKIQGKKLYVIPGSPLDEKNRGSNALIRLGARIALDPMDIIADMLGPALEKIRTSGPGMSGLSPEYKIVLEKLAPGESGIDNLIALTGIGYARLNHLLTMMEMEGLVDQYPGRVYKRKLKK